MSKRSKSKRPFCLVWMKAKDLAANPANWRQHPADQLGALSEAIERVGWAGALLYNKRTARLIDGHARKELAAPDDLLPVLVGEWTEEQEREILLTLDPIGMMAEENAEALQRLIDSVEFDTPALEALSDNLASLLPDDPGGKGGDGDGSGRPNKTITVTCPKCGHEFNC